MLGKGDPVEIAEHYRRIMDGTLVDDHVQTVVCRSGRRSKATVARASTPQKGRGLGRWRPHE